MLVSMHTVRVRVLVCEREREKPKIGCTVDSESNLPCGIPLKMSPESSVCENAYRFSDFPRIS